MSDLKKLELDKILLKLSGFAVSEDCRERLLSIEPFYDKAQVIQALQKTDDGRSDLLRGGNIKHPFQ